MAKKRKTKNKKINIPNKAKTKLLKGGPGKAAVARVKKERKIKTDTRLDVKNLLIGLLSILLIISVVAHVSNLTNTCPVQEPQEETILN